MIAEAEARSYPGVKDRNHGPIIVRVPEGFIPEFVKLFVHRIPMGLQLFRIAFLVAVFELLQALERVEKDTIPISKSLFHRILEVSDFGRRNEVAALGNILAIFGDEALIARISSEKISNRSGNSHFLIAAQNHETACMVVANVSISGRCISSIR